MPEPGRIRACHTCSPKVSSVCNFAASGAYWQRSMEICACTHSDAAGQRNCSAVSACKLGTSHRVHICMRGVCPQGCMVCMTEHALPLSGTVGGSASKGPDCTGWQGLESHLPASCSAHGMCTAQPHSPTQVCEAGAASFAKEAKQECADARRLAAGRQQHRRASMRLQASTCPGPRQAADIRAALGMHMSAPGQSQGTQIRHCDGLQCNAMQRACAAWFLPASWHALWSSPALAALIDPLRCIGTPSPCMSGTEQNGQPALVATAENPLDTTPAPAAAKPKTKAPKVPKEPKGPKPAQGAGESCA